MSATAIQPGSTRIGWIGAGVMGRSMCGHLIRAGYPITLFSRSKDKATCLLQAGANWAVSPKSVAEQTDVIFSIVGYPADVRNVHLGADGTLAAGRPGQCIVDMTTSQPDLAVEIYQHAQSIGVTAIDAPVSGGDVGARNGTLSIMLGGDAEPIQRLHPLWQLLGTTVVHQGAAGCGQHAKLVNQILIASNMVGVCESLLYAYRAGLDLDRVLQSVGGGAAGSWSLSNLGPRIIKNDFEPGFYVEHFLKDLGMALQEARRMQIALPGLALAQQLYLSLEANGGSRNGTQALQLTLARMAGIDWLNRPVLT